MTELQRSRATKPAALPGRKPGAGAGAWRTLALAAILAGAGTPASSQSRARAEPLAGPRVAGQSQVAQRLDAYLSRLARQGDLRGEVLVARGDSVVFHGRYALPGDRPAGRDERFAIASLTKTFTAAAILLLDRAGKLSLDDPVSRYVSGLPQGNEITIRMLLTHRSGLQNESTFPDFVRRLAEPMTLDQSIRRLAARPLGFAPGSRSSYSNSGYMVLASVIEQAGGTPYHDFLDSTLFRPLGMRQTEAAAAAAAAGRLAPGFLVGPGPRFAVPAPRIEFSHDVGSGSLSATVTDLYQWMRAAVDGTIVPARAHPFGWSSNRRLGMKTFEQIGNVPGYLAGMVWFERENLYVVFVNSVQSGVAFFHLPDDVAAIALGRPAEGAPFYQPAPLTRELAAAAVGHYRDSAGNTMSLVSRGADLFFQVPASQWPYGATYLTPVGDSTLLARSDDARLRLRAAGRVVTGFTWEQSGSATQWERVP